MGVFRGGPVAAQSQRDHVGGPLFRGQSLRKLQAAPHHSVGSTGQRYVPPSTTVFSHTCRGCHIASSSSLCTYAPFLCFPISPSNVRSETAGSHSTFVFLNSFLHPYQALIKKMSHRLAYGPIWLRQFPVEVLSGQVTLACLRVT